MVYSTCCSYNIICVKQCFRCLKTGFPFQKYVCLRLRLGFQTEVDPGMGEWGDRPPLKPTKVTFFTIILHNSENNIHDIRPFFRHLCYHTSVVKCTSSLLPQRSRYETWLPNITEIAPPPLSSLAGSAPDCRIRPWLQDPPLIADIGKEIWTGSFFPASLRVLAALLKSRKEAMLYAQLQTDG